MKKQTIIVCLSTLFFLGIIGAASGMDLSAKETLGKAIFFDTNLSVNNNQSCASCHDPEAGWTGSLSDINASGSVYEGSVLGRFGNRKPPSSAYATQSPIFHFMPKPNELFIGGNFWDGRATGEKLGNPAADQAQGPFLNPVEQALWSPDEVVQRVCNSDYGDLFRDVWGSEICAFSSVAAAYDAIALSIAAYEASTEVNAFTSKFDYAQKNMVKLSKEEKKGLALFKGKGKCQRCHTTNGKLPLFTDYTYDNLGTPRNPANPWYQMPAEFNPEGDAWIDAGLGGFLDSRPEYKSYAEDNMGKQKVPTLRNVDKRPYPEFVKAFGHNGYFKSLQEIVHFYNTRDVLESCDDMANPEPGVNCWPKAEVAEHVNNSELGDLGLTTEEEAAIVAFLKTLSDGYEP